MRRIGWYALLLKQVMGLNEMGDLVSFLCQCKHCVHLLRFLQQVCSGLRHCKCQTHSWIWAIQMHSTGCELKEFHRFRRDAWISSWPSKVNVTLKAEWCLCSFGSWIQLNICWFFFVLFTEIAFQPYHKTDSQNQHGQGGAEHIHGVC